LFVAAAPSLSEPLSELSLSEPLSLSLSELSELGKFSPFLRICCLCAAPLEICGL